MGVHRFTGINARDAMRQVRSALGDEALILSNRQVSGGVEIVAMRDTDREGLTGAGSDADAPSSATTPAEAPGEPVAATPPPAPTPAPAETPESDAGMAAFSSRMMEELAAMRALIHDRFVEPDAGEKAPTPGTRVRQRLTAAGFSQTLVRELIELLPAEPFAEAASTPSAESETVTDDADALDAWLIRQLEARLTTLEDEAAFLAGGGVFALIGPTGVGKTTSTAKLAARYVMAHGNRDAALVTTDSYRIAAQEQLRIYARLLGVEVHALEGDGDLGALLTRLIRPRRALLQMQKATPKRTILIDTLGMSQRDPRLAAEVARLGEAEVPIRPILVLDAASHGDTLEQVVAVYREAVQKAGLALAGCLITKLDESARPATVLDILARHRLPVIYAASGQRVPEDLEAVDVRALVENALASDPASPFGFDEATLAELAGRQEESKSRALSRDVINHGRALRTMFETLRQRAHGTALLEQQWQRARRDEAGDGFAARLDEQAREALLAEGAGALALRWSRQKPVRGADWAMPLTSLDDLGLPLPLVWLRHQLPASSSERLDWALSRHGGWQLLAAPPTLAQMHRLRDEKCLWIAPVTATRQLSHRGERHRLSALASLADPLEARACRFRGRMATLSLARLAGFYDERRSAAAPAEVEAWFATLHDPDDNRVLARRYWLASAMTGRDMPSRLVCALALEGLEGLTRKAMTRLEALGVAHRDRALRLSLAAALAALATRLELCQESWAMDVRAQLFNVTGTPRRRRAAVLLEALVMALDARDALSGAAERSE